MLNELKKLLPDNILFYNEPLKMHSTFRIGGPADLLVMPSNEEQIKVLFEFINKNNVKFIVIGNGSNILFGDEGFRGIVVKLGSSFSGIEMEVVDDGLLVHAKAGTLLSKLSYFACDNSLTGLEFAAGIPGNVGGAVLMNAGAYDGEISFVLKESTYFDIANLCFGRKSLKEHAFSYRHSSYEDDGHIILSGTFMLKFGNKDEISNKMKDLNSRRVSKQPLEFPSAGSTFKRPTGYFAGKLIEDAGLKGYSVGGAMVSDKHCGFVINKGNATCEDVLNVIEYVKKSVFEKFGVLLETEVKIIEA